MITIENVHVNVLTEESLYNGLVVAEVTASEAAIFEIISGNTDNWLYIDPAVGTVTLTPDGVEAINEDHPENPENEISEFTFRIKATSLIDGTVDERDVLVGVIRVHDEPPVIVDELITPLYVEDVATGLRVLEVRTAYAAQFTVLSGADKVTILQPDQGRVILTSAGADYIKQNSGNKLEFEIYMVDAENGLELRKTYSLDILPGTSRERIPTKNILDLVGENLGGEAGIIKAELDFDFQKFNWDSSYYFDKLKNILIYDKTTRSFADKIVDRMEDIINRTDNKIQNLNNALYIALDSIKTQLIEKIFKEINEIELSNNNLYLQQTTKIFEIETRVNEHQYLIEALKKGLQRYSEYEDDRIAEEARLAREILRSELIALITALREEFETFRDVTFVDYQAQVAAQFDVVDTRLTTNEQDIDNLEVRATDLEIRATDIETRLETQENQTLEDIDNNDGWDFLVNTLKYKQDSILTANSSQTIVGTYSGSSYIHISSSSFGNSALDVEGALFTGTAAAAKYADLAEYYSIDPNAEDIGPGRIVSFTGSHKNYEVELANGLQEPIGITSTAPGFILNNPDGKSGKWVAIALTGRVPVLVSNAFEAERGDYLYQDRSIPSVGWCSKIRRASEDCLGIVIQKLDDRSVEVKIK